MDIFCRCPLISGSISKAANIFWNILGSTYWIQSIRKNDTRIFVYLFTSKVTTTKVSFCFYKQCIVEVKHVLFVNEPYLRKTLVSFFSSNIPLYIVKNPVEKLCKILEMELKMYILIVPKFVFEKIKFKVLQVLHEIQHDFIRQHLGLSKDQSGMFKSFVINNYLDWSLWNTSKNTFRWRQYLIKGDNYFFFTKGDK